MSKFVKKIIVLCVAIAIAAVATLGVLTDGFRHWGKQTNSGQSANLVASAAVDVTDLFKYSMLPILSVDNKVVGFVVSYTTSLTFSSGDIFYEKPFATCELYMTNGKEDTSVKLSASFDGLWFYENGNKVGRFYFEDILTRDNFELAMTKNYLYFKLSVSYGKMDLGATEYVCIKDTEYTSTSNMQYEKKSSVNNPSPLPPDPIKEGHTFIGWYTDEACTQKYTDALVTDDITLYAGWEVSTYTVTFNPMFSEGFTTTVDVKYNELVSFPTPPVREGYDFVGWTFSDGTKYNNAPVKSSFFLLASWDLKICVVTFLVDGEVYSTASVSWGTKLAEAKAQAKLNNMRVISIESEGETIDFPANSYFIVNDVKATIVNMTPLDKAENFFLDNMIPITAAVGGVIVLAVVGSIVGKKRRRK